MDKKRGERDDGFPSREERQRGAHLENDDVYWLKRLAESAPALIRIAEHAPDLSKLADHAPGIIADAKNREWWQDFWRRVKLALGYISVIFASVAATIAWVQANKGKWSWW